MCKGTEVRNGSSDQCTYQQSTWKVRLDGRERAVRKLFLGHTVELGFSPEAKEKTLKYLVEKGHRQICF